MITWILSSISAMLLSILFAGILIPQILLVSFRRRLFDEPDERKIHKGAVPRLGGIAFTPVICFSVSLILGLAYLVGDKSVECAMSDNARAVAFGYCSLLMLYLVGMADDLIGVRYRAKFVAQIICAVLVIAGGLWINNLHGVFGLHHISPFLGVPLTILIVVYVINAINLIDGIDGLASGLSSVAFILYGVTFLLIGKPVYAMISFSGLGVLLQFFYYNVFGNPEKRKKIFMGDTGSLTIGLLLVFLGLTILQYAPETIPVFGTNALILALSPLIIPCFDVVRVFFRRIIRHGNPFLPDKTHIHHKILAIGFQQRTAMSLLVLSATLFSVFNIVLSKYIEVNILLLLDIAAWTLSNNFLTKMRLKHEAKVKEAEENHTKNSNP